MTTPHLQIVVKATGEVLEYNASTPEEILKTWKIASSYIDAYTQLKDRLKKVIPEFVNDRGTFEHDGHMFRVSYIQPMTYDKSALREVFDEDMLDMFLIPAKTQIDKYLKEHLKELGEDSTKLRQAMIPAGRPYTTIRLEKI